MVRWWDTASRWGTASILWQARRKVINSPPLFHVSILWRKGKRQDKRDKLGCFKHLTQVIAAGFNPTSEPAMQVNKDYKEGELLTICKDNHHWSHYAWRNNWQPCKSSKKRLLTFLNLGMIWPSVRRTMYPGVPDLSQYLDLWRIGESQRVQHVRFLMKSLWSYSHA